MPSPKNHRKGGREKNRKGRLSEKASSFHGKGDGVMAEMLPRPRTVPDLLAGRRASAEDVGAVKAPLFQGKGDGVLADMLPRPRTVPDLLPGRRASAEDVGAEKAPFFQGKGDGVVAEMLPRPRTVPDLLAGRRASAEDVVAVRTPPKLTKLLLNVNIQRSLGAVKVLLPLEAAVADLIAAALRQYAKEARLPLLPSSDASGFDLHYSQFSLESLNREEKLIALGSRNFFLCPKKAAEVAVATVENGGTVTASTSRCSKEADKATTKGLPWLKFMDFLP